MTVPGRVNENPKEGRIDTLVITILKTIASNPGKKEYFAVVIHKATADAGHFMAGRKRLFRLKPV